MTVCELIKELSELPQDLPVVVDFKEITNVNYEDGYYLDKLSTVGYSAGAIVVLE